MNENENYDFIDILKDNIEVYDFYLEHQPYPYKETRFRFTTKHIYDPNKVAKKKIINELKSQLPPSFKTRDFRNFIGITFLQFGYPYLASHPAAIKKYQIVLPKVTKPDIDKLAKLYLDCVKSCVVNEDCIFYQETIQKIHTPIPFVKIRVELTPKDIHKSMIADHLEILKKQDKPPVSKKKKK